MRMDGFVNRILNFRVHGKYGGRGYTGGQFNGTDFNVLPIDELDSLYQKHDYNYMVTTEHNADRILLQDMVNYTPESWKHFIKKYGTLGVFYLKDLIVNNKDPSVITKNGPTEPVILEINKRVEGLKRAMAKNKKLPKKKKEEMKKEVAKIEKDLVKTAKKVQKQVKSSSSRPRNNINSVGIIPKKPVISDKVQSFSHKGTVVLSNLRVASSITTSGTILLTNIINARIFSPGTVPRQMANLFQRYKLRFRLKYESNATFNTTGTFAVVWDENSLTNYDQGDVLSIATLTEAKKAGQFPAYTQNFWLSRWFGGFKQSPKYVNPQNSQSDPLLTNYGVLVISFLAATNAPDTDLGTLYLDYDVKFFDPYPVLTLDYAYISWVNSGTTANTFFPGGNLTGTLSNDVYWDNSNGRIYFFKAGRYHVTVTASGFATLSATGSVSFGSNVTNESLIGAADATQKQYIIDFYINVKINVSGTNTTANVVSFAGGTYTYTGTGTTSWRVYIWPLPGLIDPFPTNFTLSEEERIFERLFGKMVKKLQMPQEFGSKEESSDDEEIVVVKKKTGSTVSRVVIPTDKPTQ